MRVLAVLALVAVLAGSAAPARAEITDPWERVILDALCARNRCYRPEDPTFATWRARLEPIVEPLRARAGLDHVHLIGLKLKDPNAVAIIHVMGVTAGLMEMDLATDELAFVVAHELAHMRLNHVRQKISRLQTAQAIRLLNILFGDRALDPAITLIAAVILASYGRAQEIEADGLGASMAQDAGFDPCAGVRLMVRLAPRGRANTGDLFDDHPSMQERIARLERTHGCAVPSPEAKVVTLRAQANAGPLWATVAAVEFARDATTVSLTLANEGDAEIDLFSAVAGATLAEGTGRVFAVRLLRSTFPDRLPAAARARARLVFEPVPPPPAVIAMALVLPDIRVGEQTYVLRVDLPLTAR